MSWVWLLPLGLAAGAAGGLWPALRHLRRELQGLARATSTLAQAADEARSRRAPGAPLTPVRPGHPPSRRR